MVRDLETDRFIVGYSDICFVVATHRLEAKGLYDFSEANRLSIKLTKKTIRNREKRLAIFEEFQRYQEIDTGSKFSH